jgi:hypothetical protein
LFQERITSSYRKITCSQRFSMIKLKNCTVDVKTTITYSRSAFTLCTVTVAYHQIVVMFKTMYITH